jgi:hypothetical protein
VSLPPGMSLRPSRWQTLAKVRSVRSRPGHGYHFQMIPFNPDAEFEQLVLELNEQHRPGSLVSGKTRNALLWAWALFAGRTRAEGELAAAVERHGSKKALARALSMSLATLREYEDHVHSLNERYNIPSTAHAFRDAFGRLTASSQVQISSVFVELLRKPGLLRHIASSRSATRLLETALRANELEHAIERLRGLLSSGVRDEKNYQDWCGDHSWVFGGAHQIRDAIRRLDQDSVVDLLHPDIVGYRDVVELKRPDVDVLKYDRSHRTYYFSSDVSRAVGQVHKYMDRLHDLARKGLPNHAEIVAYHPRATIVIGRTQGWSTLMADTLRGLNQRLHGIEVMTYDHLLLRAETILRSFQSA